MELERGKIYKAMKHAADQCPVMHRSAKSQTPPNAVNLLLSCEGL